MSTSLSSVKIKPDLLKHNSFFSKLLHRRHSNSLGNTSWLSTADSLEGDSFSNSADLNLLSLKTQLDRTYVDSGLLMYNQDVDGDNDILLNPDADIISSSDTLALDEKYAHFPNSPLFSDSENIAQESVWSNLTYEALDQPKYFKPLRKGKKSPKLLNNIFLAQELRCLPPTTLDTDSGSEADIPESSASKSNLHFSPMNREEILVMEFSRDGKYLAVAGRDTRITVWQVISSPLSKLEFSNKEAADAPIYKRNRKLKLFRLAPVFLQNPTRIFEGHTNTILCLHWSKNNFLASGSMDKTVKLWNIDREGCLATFEHSDFVTGVKFHPNDDRFFLSGTLDDSVQLWSILERSVAYSKSFGNGTLITALEFTPSGDHCIVGAFDGSLYVLETQGLRQEYRVDIKERSVHNPFHSREDRKITGIRAFINHLTPYKLVSNLGKTYVLVTTNDSNIRLICLQLKKLLTRFRGSHNEGLSVIASMTDDSAYFISGSLDGNFYVWKNDHSIINNKIRASLKEIYEDGKDTLAQKQAKLSKIIPESTGLKRLLSTDETSSKHFISNENNSHSSIHAHRTKCNFAIFAPERTKRLLEFSDDVISDLLRRKTLLDEQNGTQASNKDAQEELIRGEIIITCDTTGLIRVFRQDSAYFARKSITEAFKTLQREDKGDISDTASIAPSRTSYRAEMSKGLCGTRSSSPSQDAGSSLKMKLQSKINTNSARNPPQTYPTLLSFPSLDQTVSGSGMCSETKQNGTLNRVSGSSSNLMTRKLLNGRARSVSASELTQGRAPPLMLSSMALSSTKSLVTKSKGSP